MITNFYYIFNFDYFEWMKIYHVSYELIR